MTEEFRPGATVAELGVQWDDLRYAWVGTHARIRALPDAELRRRVDDEWSALETLRHLVFVHDIWFATSVRGTFGHHAIGLPPDFLAHLPHEGLDPAADPTLADVLNVRQQQLDAVERFLDVADDDLLASAAAGAPDWSPGARTIRECLATLVTEEWLHHSYCERDLAALGH